MGKMNELPRSRRELREIDRECNTSYKKDKNYEFHVEAARAPRARVHPSGRVHSHLHNIYMFYFKSEFDLVNRIKQTDNFKFNARNTYAS